MKRMTMLMTLLWAAPVFGQWSVEQAEPMLDLKATTQTISPQNHRMQFVAHDALGEDRNFVGWVERVEGTPHPGAGTSPKWNTAAHQIHTNELTVEGNNITGKLTVKLRPDRWVPADKQPRELVLNLDAQIDPQQKLPADVSGMGDDTRFWTMRPISQTERSKLTGEFTSEFEGQRREGKLTGSFAMPIANDKWNMGHWVRKTDEHPAGVAFAFDLGQKRQNWNFARLAVLGFEQPRDLSKWDGLRIGVFTDKPRDDALVSVWMMEADGSWYYLKGAVPLVDRQNQAVVRFADFAEAEWVAPGSHMDEDYVFDRSGVAKIAIGIINPHGIGEVDFILTELQLVDIEKH
jgi:hypothetical protein